MKLTRPTAVLMIAGVLALGAGCSSSSDDSASGGGASTTASSGGDAADTGGDSGDEQQTVEAPDVCPQVDTAAVAAAGVPTEGTPSDYPGPPGTAIGVCSFGSIGGDGGVLVVQVENKTKDAIIDPVLTVLKNAVDEPPTAASKPDGAKVYSLAVIPGGGGIGKTVAWESDTRVVVAAQTGDAVDAANLETIVAGIVDKG